MVFLALAKINTIGGGGVICAVCTSNPYVHSHLVVDGAAVPVKSFQTLAQ